MKPLSLFNYSGLIDSEGQTDAQAPQSIHFSPSMTKISPSEMASTGHSATHVPHATQLSLITYAILYKF